MNSNGNGGSGCVLLFVVAMAVCVWIALGGLEEPQLANTHDWVRESEARARQREADERLDRFLKDEGIYDGIETAGFVFLAFFATGAVVLAGYGVYRCWPWRQRKRRSMWVRRR